jgi:hypothetical protein
MAAKQRSVLMARKLTPRKTFNPMTARDGSKYPEQERLFLDFGEQEYLRQVRNPFNEIMANTFPQRYWETWDILLAVKAPMDRVDKLLGKKATARP